MSDRQSRESKQANEKIRRAQQLLQQAGDTAGSAGAAEKQQRAIRLLKQARLLLLSSGEAPRVDIPEQSSREDVTGSQENKAEAPGRWVDRGKSVAPHRDITGRNPAVSIWESWQKETPWRDVTAPSRLRR